jgi:hypothetical protein
VVGPAQSYADVGSKRLGFLPLGNGAINNWAFHWVIQFFTRQKYFGIAIAKRPVAVLKTHTYEGRRTT